MEILRLYLLRLAERDPVLRGRYKQRLFAVSYGAALPALLTHEKKDTHGQA